MLRSAEGIGTALAQAGRFLPAPNAKMRHHAIAVQPLPAAWPAATVH